MEISWTVIIYLIFLVDSIGSILVAWFAGKWWNSYVTPFSKHFPAAKGWSALYFALVLYIGYLLGII